MAVSAAALLWAGRLSRMTTSPGSRVGASWVFDVSLEDPPIHRRVDDERSGERAAAQAGDEGLGLPMSERSLGEKPSALQATAAQARHLGGGSGLVKEDQPVRLKPHLRLTNGGPFLARLLDVRTIVLACPQVFFETIAGANEPARQRSGMAFSPVAAASSAASSGMVMSAFSATYTKRNDRCGSSLAWPGPHSAWVRSFPASEPPSPGSPRREPTP